MILGLRKRKEKKYTVYKNDWLEFCTGFHKWSFKISPAGYFDNRAQIHISLIWGQWFISIPFIRSKYEECDPPDYGFYFYSPDSWIPSSFVWRWGRKSYHYDMPWGLKWIRTSSLRKDGGWEHEDKKNKNKNFWDKEKWNDILWFETYPYTYILNNGEVQERNATVSVIEREWRPKWFKWTKLFNFTRRVIDIDFDGEVGERSGSWKGGTTGCSYDLLKGETPLDCLRRMEKERKF